jgi:NADH dehydrogenase (ubiquinone) Fe-S protein 1
LVSQTPFSPGRAFSSTTINNDEVEIFVDGKSVKIEQGAALIQACEKAGADVSF